MSTPSSSGVYVEGGALLVLITVASVEQAGLVPGRTYEALAIGAGALVKYGTDAATIADGGFDWAVSKNGPPMRFVMPAGVTLINVIESDDTSSASAILLISEVEG